jgi:hypothetical protein
MFLTQAESVNCCKSKYVFFKFPELLYLFLITKENKYIYVDKSEHVLQRNKKIS